MLLARTAPVPLARPAKAFAVTLLALALPALAAPAAAALPSGPETVRAAAPRPAVLTVSGEGSATGKPDMAVVHAGVEVTEKTSKDAMNAQSKAARALLAAVRARGIADKDIRTEGLSLGPQYTYTSGKSELTGYRAAQSFTVKVRRIGDTGAVLQAVTDATGDAGRIHSVAFDVADPAALRTQARKDAHRDARAKALEYAEFSGHRLGRLVSLTDSATSGPHPLPMAKEAFDSAGASVPLAPGEIQSTASVTAVYELV
ncbi:SIMPL domain-containing protein [Streptomyces sp. TRM66268-LWL]|uniref:SIMPL domain-containing protein n=1 Tax=Streptomyces polyasparticus TaxID=2767826 RepID=A0ABR7SBW4_9ACTN|nr:SIMPL domain-containing protein [Streptomyces polyasparticus]MBC9711838.1 SIMPL domain-containing protein [Streptomyces polyasparticus]